MSGPLRRNQRSRPADAGEPLQEGLAAEPEGAAPTAETPQAAPESGREPATEPRAEAAAQPASDEPAGQDVDTNPDVAATDESAGATKPAPSAPDESGGATTPATASEDAAPATSDETETPAEGVAPTTKSRRSRWRPLGKAKRTPADEPSPAATPGPAPVLVADPNTPAGLDPAEAPMRPPTGRRGRLRRRLRYLRRARELMLRDLGGLLYEVHRTGGGRIERHATVIGAKVQRIAGLDAEAHALETALEAPRSETVVFEPGVGGTCATCGELYGSDAHFCSNCGAPVARAAPVAPPAESKPADGADEPTGRGFWRRAARAPEAAPDTTSDETAVMTPAPDPAAGGDEPPADATPGEASGDAPAEETPKTDAAHNEASSAAGDDGSRNPSARARNGRPEEYKPPGLSSGDPLAGRESRS